MSRQYFEAEIERVLARLPEEYAGRLDNLVFLVEDLADSETLGRLGIESSGELLGLYHGTPLTERTHDQIVYGPDRIYLFRKTIEAEARTSGLPLQQVIRETLWHEIAHFFGFSEEEMDRIETVWAGSE